MIDILNKDIRKSLINKYLNADTTAEEEKDIVKYYLANNDVDNDELAFAELIRMEHANSSLLSTEGAEEYDRIISKKKAEDKEENRAQASSILSTIPWRWMTLIGGMAACLILLLSPKKQQQESDLIDMAHSLEQLVNLNNGDDITITAIPIGKSVWVEVVFADGTKKTFVMSQDKAMNTTSFLSIN